MTKYFVLRNFRGACLSFECWRRSCSSVGMLKGYMVRKRLGIPVLERTTMSPKTRKDHAKTLWITSSFTSRCWFSAETRYATYSFSVGDTERLWGNDCGNLNVTRVYDLPARCFSRPVHPYWRKKRNASISLAFLLIVCSLQGLPFLENFASPLQWFCQ